MTNVNALQTLFKSLLSEWLNFRVSNGKIITLLDAIKPLKFVCWLLRRHNFLSSELFGFGKRKWKEERSESSSQLKADDFKWIFAILIATCYVIMVFVSSCEYSLEHPLEQQITLTMIQSSCEVDSLRSDETDLSESRCNSRGGRGALTASDLLFAWLSTPGTFLLVWWLMKKIISRADASRLIASTN